MATFARDAAQASQETHAADAALDEWLAEHDLGREATRAELEALVRELAAVPDLWRRHVRHSPVERLYVRLHLDAHLEVWLICWSQRQDTGFHDHDQSRGAVAVVGGALAERRLAVGGPPPPTAIHPAGAAFSFGATHIHDVSQTGPGPATSLHVYSPPLGEMGFYEVGPDGMLGRRTGDYREEFC
jgi:predicted metal-dependent enzyme (double-stranded beta helix superfamily)